MKYVTEIFALDAKYLNRLARLKPEFGYDGFGEIVFYRTYSRLKADGSQENWHDVVVRVINGTMSIRKDWYKRNYIDWDEAYWQRFAFSMAVSMFHMYWLPAGRGMWAMGTPFVFERGSMALNNCFSGETKFLADGQLQTLRECVGRTVIVNNGNEAVIQSFGKQMLYNIVLKPASGNSKYRLNYTATMDHRWILADGTETTSLKPGNRIKIQPGQITTDSQEYKDGFVHGMVFADGCNHYRNSYYIQLCGWKNQYRDTIAASKWYTHTIDTEQRMILESNTALKALPEDESLEYKQGFIDGWKLFDGHWKNESYCIDTIHPNAAQWISDHSGILNYVMVGHSKETTDTNFGKRNKPLQRIKIRFESIDFIVDCKVYSGRNEEVYCAVEPKTHSFQLAGGVVTGNCGFTVLGGNDRLSDDCHWLMDALMLGVGVGFEAVRDDLKIYQPVGEFIHFIPDSREGWADSWKMLIDAYTKPGCRKPKFRYDLIRKKGLPIRGFGGLASGPEPLIRLHQQTEELFETPGIDVVRLKTDLGNMCGCCVVAGNVRRSAELNKGKVNDPIFLDLKDYEKYPEREDYGWMSNNSVALESDLDFEMLGEVAKRVVVRGK